MEVPSALPTHQIPLPRPLRKTQPGTSRAQSSALRASVLDVALELGIGNNSLVADWMFNETIQEDEEPVSSPGLTYGSSATSEESSSSALTPSSSHSPNTPHLKSQPFGLHFPTDVIQEETTVEQSPASAGPTVGFMEPPPPLPTTPAKGKLRKKVKGDGYESDAGYMSEGGKRKDKKEAKEKEKERKKKEKEKAKEAEAAEKLERESAKSVQGAEPEERKRKKSLVSVIRGKKSLPDLQLPAQEETDANSKSPAKSKSRRWKSSKAESSADAGVDYETDASASSKKSKSRFFKLGSKSSKANLKEPVPALPAFLDNKDSVPLPIAEKFGTTLSPTNDSTSNSANLLPSLDFKPFTHSAEASVSSTNTWNTTATSTTFLSSAPTSASNSNGTFNGLRDSQVSVSAESSSSHSHAAKGPSYNNSLDVNPSSPVGNISRSTTPASPSKGGSFLPRAFSPLPSNSRATSPSPAMRMNPGISFPFTRALSPPPSIPTSPSKSKPTLTAPPPLSLSSPAPPSTYVSPPPSTGMRVKPSLENLNLMALRSNQPSPMSPASPYVVVTPLVTPIRSSPGMNGNGSVQDQQLQYQQQQSKLSPAPQFPARMARAPSPMRIRTGDASLYLPLPKSPAPPSPNTMNSASSGSNANLNSAGISSQYLNVYPNPHRESQMSMTMSPVGDYVVPSPSQSPLLGPSQTSLSPSTLSYYDIPPPTPPPVGPLPSVPVEGERRGGGGYFATHGSSNGSGNGNGNASDVLPSPAALRQRVIDRTVRQLPDGFATPIQRGKEAPFPTRPVMPYGQNFNGSGNGGGSSSASGNGGVGVGIGSLAGGPGGNVGSGAAARTYRDANGHSESPSHEFIREQAEKRRLARLRPKRSVHFDDDGFEDEGGDDGCDERYNEEEDDREEMRGVLDRFEMNVEDESESVVVRPGAYTNRIDVDEEKVDSPVTGPLGRGSSNDDALTKSSDSNAQLYNTPSKSRFYNVNARKDSDIHGMQSTSSSPSPAPSFQLRNSQSSYEETTLAYRDSDSHITSPSPPPGSPSLTPSPGPTLAIPQLRPRAREPESEYTMGDRTSRWSGSVYSRNSLLDPEESEQTRGRFIDRVRAMLSEKEDGSGLDRRGEYVPPVPRLPDAYATTGAGGGTGVKSRWGRF